MPLLMLLSDAADFPHTAGSRRTPGQRRADALVQIAREFGSAAMPLDSV